jgi:hypothetical protein
MLDAVGLDGAKGLIEKRTAQIPMVVRLCGLLSCSRVCGTIHTKSLVAHVVPFIVLVIATLILRGIGAAAGAGLLNSWIWCLRGGLALMFL